MRSWLSRADPLKSQPNRQLMKDAHNPSGEEIFAEALLRAPGFLERFGNSWTRSTESSRLGVGQNALGSGYQRWRWNRAKLPRATPKATPKPRRKHMAESPGITLMLPGTPLVWCLTIDGTFRSV
jgi:hypothetical protein